MSPFHEKVVPLRVPVPVAATQGTLALDLQPRHDPPPATLVAVGSGSAKGADEWARRFAQAAVEIVGGDRPVSQLLRWTDRAVYADLHRRALLVARAGGHTPGQARVQPTTPRVLSATATARERSPPGSSVGPAAGSAPHSSLLERA